MKSYPNERECERGLICLNFRRDGPTYCTTCEVKITMNHFHDNLKNVRLCNQCLDSNLQSLVSGTFNGPETGPEPRECANFERCFTSHPFGMYVPKTCDQCQRDPLPQHFHDIERNIRLCLQCYCMNKSAEA